MRISYINQEQVQKSKPEQLHGEKKTTAASAESVAGALSGVLFGSVQKTGNGFPGYGKNGGEEGKMTAGELRARMGVTDTSLQLKYMTVMSNSMSGEDYGRLLEDGFDPADVDVETAVTILDHIKAAVAAGGTEVAGFTDTLSKEQLKDIFGSNGMAQALSTGLCSKDMEYMLRNKLAPTAANIFLAKNSSGAAEAERLTAEATPSFAGFELAEDPAFLRQTEAVILQAGLEVTEETREDAFLLLSMEIPLTAQNLERLEALKEFRTPLPEEEIKRRVALQAAAGTEPAQADLSKTESIYETALRVAAETENLTEADADAVIASGKTLTLQNAVRMARKSGKETEASQTGLVDANKERELLSARRVLEEVRLSMTVDANLRLLRKGISLETTPMVELVDALKQAEKELQAMGVAEAFRVQDSVESLRNEPLEALSFVASGETAFTVAGLGEKGAAIRDSLQAESAEGAVYKLDAKLTNASYAQKRYEQSATEVRSDLGDSVKKALRNTDALLDELGLEVSEENRRAVRILSGRSMELTEDNMQRARDLDRQLQTLFDDLKPARILHLVKEGIDILHTDIAELDRYLQTIPVPLAEEKADYARFLQKLQHGGSISEEEREGYIQVVRLIRRTEKAEGRAEAFLLGTEAAPTLENLLTALNTRRKSFVDVKADRSFGGVDGDVYRSLEFLHRFNQPVTLNNSEQAENLLQDSSALFTRLAEMEEKLLSGETAAEDPVKTEEVTLVSEGVPAEATGKGEKRGGAVRGKEVSAFTDLVRDLQAALDREDSLASAWDEFADRAEEMLSVLRDAPEASGLDLMAMRQLSKGLLFGKSLARESHYQIPFETEEGFTVVHLTLKKGDGNPSAEISMEVGEYGKLRAYFEKTRQEKKETPLSRHALPARCEVELSYAGNGYVTADTAVGKELAERIAKTLSENSGSEVYETAKLFIDIVRKAI